MSTYPTRQAAETYLRQHGYAFDGVRWVHTSGSLVTVAEVQETPAGFIIAVEART